MYRVVSHVRSQTGLQLCLLEVSEKGRVRERTGRSTAETAARPTCLSCADKTLNLFSFLSLGTHSDYCDYPSKFFFPSRLVVGPCRRGIHGPPNHHNMMVKKQTIMMVGNGTNLNQFLIYCQTLWMFLTMKNDKVIVVRIVE